MVEALFCSVGRPAVWGSAMVSCCLNQSYHMSEFLKQILVFIHKLSDFRASASWPGHATVPVGPLGNCLLCMQKSRFESHQTCCTCAGHMDNTGAVSPVFLRHVTLAMLCVCMHNCPGNPWQEMWWYYAYHTMYCILKLTLNHSLCFCVLWRDWKFKTV